MKNRRSVNLAAFDLNLLVAFDALMSERNVSRAAEKVGLSQPAMSNALRRMRDIFGDDLFLRSGHSMVPTGVAMELGQMISPALVQIRVGLEMQLRFDPATTLRRFVVGFHDIGSVRALPVLTSLMRQEAPGATLEVVDLGASGDVDLLLSGRVELAIGDLFREHEDISRARLVEHRYVILADQRNPRLRDGRLSPADIAALPHLSFAPLSEDAEIDRRLAERGLEREIKVSVPHYLAVPGAVAGTDMIAYIDEWVGDSAVSMASLTIVPDPLDVPSRSLEMVWHRRHDNDPALTWLRGKLMSLGEEAARQVHPELHSA